MEYKLIIDKNEDESLVLTVKERNEFVNSVEQLLNADIEVVRGYKEDEIFLIPINKADCFYTGCGKVYMRSGKQILLIKQRICSLEEKLPSCFLKINQGCIINVSCVKKFEVSVGGAIKVILKNGFEDYISRRELKKVKRRFGI